MSTKAKRFISRQILLKAYCEYNECLKGKIYEKHDSTDETLLDDIEDAEGTMKANASRP